MAWDRLTTAIPRGATDPKSGIARAVTALIAAGLLRRVDADTVELPREVGMALRGDEPLGPIQVTPPKDTVREPGVRTVDGTGGGQAVATVDRLGRLLDDIGQSPPPALKSGGLGIRELRRLAKAMGTDELVTAMDVEVLAAAGLIAAVDARGRVTESWTPTTDADDFLDGPTRRPGRRSRPSGWTCGAIPSRVGSRDASDKVQNALSPELSWIRGPAERRFVLNALAELPPGSGLDLPALSARLAWRSPLRPAEQRDAVLTATIAEATAMGVVAFTALTTAGRELLAGSTAGAEAALAKALPEPGRDGDGAGRPDRRGSGPAGAAARGPARPGRRRRVRRQRHRLSGDAAVDPPRAGRRGVDRRTTRAVQRPFGDRRPTGAELPDR